MSTPESSPPKVMHYRVGRTLYFTVGFLLVLVKFIQDSVTARLLFDREWTFINYLEPSRYYNIWTLPQEEWLFFATLLGMSIPYMAVGFYLTYLRLRDADWSPFLSFLFFVPLVNLFFFIILSFAPPAPGNVPSILPSASANRLSRIRIPGILCALAGAVFGLAMAILGIYVLQNYAWGLFLGVPIAQGLVAGILYSLHDDHQAPNAAGVAAASVLLTGLGVLLFNIDGIICIFMAAPIAFPSAMMGGYMGYHVRETLGARKRRTAHYIIAPWLLVPAVLAVEKQFMPNPPLHAITTSVHIKASAATVWENVVTFSELPPPTDRLFHTGIAYSIRATITGTGVGAVRHCEFSTGPFIEPITVWDEPHRLAFDVTAQPPPLEELTLFADHIHPPHIEGGFLHSEKGQFLLAPQSDGSILLQGTTWYRNSMWPTVYWYQWSDWIIHRIHLQVLSHIKRLSERHA